MSSFTAPLLLSPAGGRWVTRSAFRFWIGRENSGVGFDVPEGFVTDLGSIPRWLWWLLPRDDPRFAQAFVGHDWLCEVLAFPRIVAATILFEMLAVLAMKHKAPWWRVWVMFWGVFVWAIVRPMPRVQISK